jgi:hypothetical protein
MRLMSSSDAFEPQRFPGVRHEISPYFGVPQHLDRIAEFWDIGQAVPGSYVNENGMF